MSFAQAVAQEAGEGAQLALRARGALQAILLILRRFQHIAQPSFAFSVVLGEVIRALGISLQAWGLWGVFFKSDSAHVCLYVSVWADMGPFLHTGHLTRALRSTFSCSFSAFSWPFPISPFQSGPWCGVCALALEFAQAILLLHPHFLTFLPRAQRWPPALLLPQARELL